MEVLPESAAPWMSRVGALSLRMTAFCSRCMLEMMERILSVELCASSRCSSSSCTLSSLSMAYSMTPPAILNWRLQLSVPSMRPEGAS